MSGQGERRTVRSGPSRLNLDIEDHDESDLEFDWIRIKGETPEKLLDILSLEHDFHAARATCDLFLETENTPSNDGLRHALWESLVVTYGRAFQSGKGDSGKSRYRLPPEFLKHLSESQQALHEQDLQVRNQHVAHRVDDREVGIVYIRVTKDRSRAVPFVKLASQSAADDDYVVAVADLCKLG